MSTTSDDTSDDIRDTSDDEFVLPLILGLDVVSLAMGLVTVASPSGAEGPLAAEVERVLAPLPHFAVVTRVGDTVVARTELGLPERVVLAAHLDTAPAPEPHGTAYVEMGRLVGPGACDAKGGLAVLLKLAAHGDFTREVTFVLYDGACAAGTDDGLTRLARTDPDLLAADLAVVLDPSGARVELPGSASPDDAAVRAFAEAVGGEPRPGPDRAALAPFAALGVPAVVYGPGDPALAGGPEEYVPTAQLAQCEHLLKEWLQR